METFLPSWVAALQSQLVNPEEKYLLSSSHKTVATLVATQHHRVSAEKTQNMRTQDYRPQIAEVHLKKIIVMSPDSCIFPHVEKHSIP